MRAASAAVLLAGVAVALARAQVPARDNPSVSLPNGAVRGRVLSADNGEPIRKARIELVGGTGDRQDPVYSDNDGRFAFTPVLPGRYAVTAWKSGYAATIFGARKPWEPPRMIAVDPGQTVEGIDLILARGGSISGRILDDAGEPLPDMQVTVGRAVPVNGRLRFQAAARAATTDDRGEFRVGGLPAGTYVVNAFGWTGPSTATRGAPSGPRPYATFFPQTPFLGQARSVIVRPGEDVSAVDVMFSAETMVMPTVSGRVIDSRGVTVPASLSAVSNGNGVDADARGVFVGMQTGGEFRVTLSPGEYTLVAQSFEMTALTQLTVDRADVSGIDLVLVKGAQVNGRVIFDGTAARPGGLAVAASCAGQRNVDFADATRRPGRVQPNGSFSLSNLIGTCELGLTPEPREWRIKSIRAAGRDLLDVPMAFTGGADLRDVQIVLTDRRAELGGTIAGAPPAAFAGTLSVLVFPDDPRQIGRRAQWVRPDQHGRFVVSNLTPGVYLVALATDVDDTRWQTADYLDGLRSAAARVTLGDGETQSITLRWSDPR